MSVRYVRLRAVRGGLAPREIKTQRWVLYPVDNGKDWALCHLATGGLVEGMNGSDLLDLVDLLSSLGPAEALDAPVEGT